MLESNNLRGHLPACLGELGHLKVLRLCSNQLAGGIPQEIGGCKALRELVLNQNELTGKCIQACRPSTRAHHGARARSRRARHGAGHGTAHGAALTAAQTPAQTALAALGASPATPAQVVTLLVCNRDLVWCAAVAVAGVIPEAIGKCQRLTLLSCWNNQLTGTGTVCCHCSLPLF